MSFEYTDIITLENYLGYTIDAGFQDQVKSWIKSISGYINIITGRVFIADTEASARYYGGKSKRTLRIDECVEVEIVEIGRDYYGDTLTEVDDYILLPENYEQKGIPIDKIYLKKNYFYPGINNHKITAKWGYSATVPEDLKLATTIIVAGILKKQVSTGKDIVSEKIGDYQVAYDKAKGLTDFENARSIIESYTKFTI